MEVIILAGGLGTRLRSVVHEIPKCLAPIGPNPCAARPFLGYLLEWLVGQGVNHVVFSVGYLHEQVMAYVQSREWPFEYDFAVETEPLGTGGGIRLALAKCREDHVFVVNGDTFFPVDLSAIPFDAPITLALKPMKDFDRYGAVSVAHTDALRVTAFHEKKPCKEGLINGGIYAIDRTRLNLSDLPQKFSFEKEVLEPGAAIGQIGGWISDAYFIDIGIPEDYQKAQWAIPAWLSVQRASERVLASQADTLFLDRDGVINEHLIGDYVKDWSMFRFLPGIKEELAKWARKFRYIILVTNQRGVGRGLMTDSQLAKVHAHMMAEILEAGGRIDLILACTAVSDQDPRRKPNPGMFYEARTLYPDLGRCIMVGDTASDQQFARNCGMPFILLEAVS